MKLKKLNNGGIYIFKAKEIEMAALTAMLLSSVAVLVYFFTWSEGIGISEFCIVSGAAYLIANSLLFLLVGFFDRKRALKVTAIVLVAALNFVAAFSTTVYYMQGQELFYPNNSTECFKTLKTEGTFHEIAITARDGTRLDGWLKINSDKAPAPLLIFFGGNGQNSSKAFDNFSKNGTFEKFNGYNVLMIDYRGYGYSTGTASDTALFSDSLDVYDYAVKQSYTDKTHVVAMGYSLGTGVATYLAAQRHTAGLVLVAPYYDGESLCNSEMDIFHGPLELLVRYKFDTEGYAPQVTATPLIFTSKTDDTISYKQSEKLAGRFKKVYKFDYIKGVNHNQYFGNKEMLSEISDYLIKIKEGGAQ